MADNLRNLRVQDPILTSISREYSGNEDLVGMTIFPAVPVSARAGKIIFFNSRAGKKTYSTLRAPGSATKRMESSYSSEAYSIEDHSLEAMITIEEQEEAAVAMIDLEARRVREVQDAMALELEIKQIQLATTAGNYGASNKITLSGATKWSHASSDPVSAVETAKTAIYNAMGKEPTSMTISRAIFSALKTNPSLMDRMKYHKMPDVNLNFLSELFGVPVQISKARSANDAGTSETALWGNFAQLCYNVVGSMSKGEMTFGYTYQLNGYPLVEQSYPERNTKSQLYPVTNARMPVIAGADAGYLFSDVI